MNSYNTLEVKLKLCFTKEKDGHNRKSEHNVVTVILYDIGSRERF